ncbi:MAG: hypothetical protein NC293_04995 [Roseburia sp.]|nr:hypothetical protein [Roseburia sp.]
MFDDLLAWSYILEYENEKILSFAESLADKGIKKFDALHISCAVYAKCDYFLTTDKKLLNASISEIKVVNPIDFVNEMED